MTHGSPTGINTSLKRRPDRERHDFAQNVHFLLENLVTGKGLDTIFLP